MFKNFVFVVEYVGFMLNNCFGYFEWNFTIH
jgi:hypothetical protein